MLNKEFNMRAYTIDLKLPIATETAGEVAGSKVISRTIQWDTKLNAGDKVLLIDREGNGGSGKLKLVSADSAKNYSEVFEGLKKCEIAEEGFAYPNATSLVMLAHAQALREQWVKPWDLEPMYLRKPDAEINWSTRPGA
jgi:tRNA A37 threonylcarbamoyladenosine modification protein TsaB